MRIKNFDEIDELLKKYQVLGYWNCSVLQDRRKEEGYQESFLRWATVVTDTLKKYFSPLAQKSPTALCCYDFF